ncbi:MAG: TIGR00730 family Rossman fold protein [Betaproteobacteria bacterium]
MCVFCGSQPGARDNYALAAQSLAAALAHRGLGLVYGGGNVGMMGVLADAMLQASGTVIGVIPRALVAKEVAHRGVTELRVVDTMHQRKAMMNELSDAFVALPGGFGTLEELFEILTWAQLGIHGKPCAILNVSGYYDGLMAMLDHAVAERFLRPAHRELLIVDTDASALLQRLDAIALAQAAIRPPMPGNFS